jgi:hypothetical protein
MIAISEANLSRLNNLGYIRTLDLYTAFPELVPTVQPKKQFCDKRLVLTLHDAVNIEELPILMEAEISEVDDALAKLNRAPRDMQLIENVKKETADVVVFANTVQIFANGSWVRFKPKVLEAVNYAKQVNLSVGGNLAEDVTGVVTGKNDANYLTHIFDWAWALYPRENVNEESVSRVYGAAKKECRILRDNHTTDGVLPKNLGFVASWAMKTKEKRDIVMWQNDPLIKETVSAFLRVYEVAATEFKL